MPGTKPVINEGALFVHESGLCQIEWYRGNNSSLLASQVFT